MILPEKKEKNETARVTKVVTPQKKGTKWVTHTVLVLCTTELPKLFFGA